MKPLLRTLLILDGLLALAAALGCLGAHWADFDPTWRALIPDDAALLAWLFGIALLALAVLRFAAAFNGALTTQVARVLGHANWVSGVLVLVALLALHQPALSGTPQALAALAGVVLIVLGLLEVRLAAAVRRKALFAGQPVSIPAGRAGVSGVSREERADAAASPRAASDVPAGAAPYTGTDPATGERAADAGRPASRWRPFGRRAGAGVPPVEAPGGERRSGSASTTDTPRPPPPL